MTRLFAACALATLLAGCATTADRLRGSVQPPAGQGHAIVAMTVRTYAPDTASATLYWHGVDNALSGSLRADFAQDTIFAAPRQTASCNYWPCRPGATSWATR